MRHLSLYTIAALVSLTALTGCFNSTEPIPDAYHTLDHSPAEGDVWRTNQAVTLERERWLIFQRGDTHYMFPRPDGEPYIAEACEAGGEDAKFFASVKACSGATNQADAGRVNSLTWEEAVRISSFLHGALAFEPQGSGLRPHALLSDIVRVCKADPDKRAGALKDLCDFEMGHAAKGVRPSIARQLSSTEAPALAEGLNALYGVEAK